MNNMFMNMIQSFGGMSGFTNAIKQTDDTLRGQGTSAEERVRDMLNSGKSTQAQFQFAAQIANMLCGRK